MFGDHEKRYYGVYIGLVVYNKDPNHLGRIQVRVDEIYGDSSEDSQDTDLPWAPVLQFFGGFHGGGSHLPFPVGSTVALVFEEGDKNRPIILGGVPKLPDPSWLYGDSETSMKSWAPDDSETDLPVEVREDREETRYVTLKTPKGATILIEERDEEEFLRIIDRGGQVLEMACPVKEASNLANAERRGDRSVLTEDQVVYSSVVGAEATIRLTDLAGQYIRLRAKEEDEVIEIHGRKRGTPSEDQTVVIQNTKDDEEIKITDKAGQTVTMRAATGEEKIRLDNAAGDSIEIDRASNTITVNTDGIVNITGSAQVNITSTGPVNITSSGDNVTFNGNNINIG